MNTKETIISDNILKITFTASTVDGSIIKNENYKPFMSNPSIYKDFPNILFIPSIKITRGLFDSNLGEDDIKKIFLSPTQLDNFISRLRENNLYKPITIANAKEKGIIYNNIKFILELFFKKGNSLTLNSTPYVINSYKWDNKYVLKTISGKKAPQAEIFIEIYLHKGSELSFTESTRLSCVQKKAAIVEEYNKLVGLNKNSGKTAPISTFPVDKTPPIVKNKSRSRARARAIPTTIPTAIPTTIPTAIPTTIPINSVGGKTRRKKGNKKQNKSKRAKSKKYF